MVSDKKLANAIGGKTARACDGCIRKRARWYCPADDAFLCQACDSSVHSANSLARRHKRVRLKTESMTNFKSPDESPLQSLFPTWYRMSTRKPRTPRHGKQGFFGKPKSDELMQNPIPLVPEIGTDEASPEEDEEQLLYRVPIFDQFAAELCRSANSNDEEDRVFVAINDSETADGVANELKGELYDCGHGVNSLHGFDTDLADFAADVESLLGKGLEDESFDMKGLGLMDSKEDHDSVMEDRFGEGKVKVEEGGGGEEDTEAVMAHHTDTEMDMTREAFELSFDFDSPATCDEEDEKEKKVMESDEIKCGVSEENINSKKKKILLRLDYEGVIAAWDNQGCPWTTGDRPVLDPNDCWPDCMGGCGWVDHNTFGEMGVVSGHSSGMVDGGREARVSRYREKRRTRLFSKKIRYEVRKLNAEKRPRMKGRFVKRANFAAPSSCFPLLTK